MGWKSSLNAVVISWTLLLDSLGNLNYRQGHTMKKATESSQRQLFSLVLTAILSLECFLAQKEKTLSRMLSYKTKNTELYNV